MNYGHDTPSVSIATIYGEDVGTITDADLSIDTGTVEALDHDHDHHTPPEEFEFSVSFDVAGQTVVCGHCGTTNTVPRMPVLSIMDDPACVECGTPLQVSP